MDNQNVMWAMIGLMIVVMLIPILVFAWFGRIWVQCLFSGAQVSIVQLIMMKIRKTPVKKMSELYIMSTQTGLNIRLVELERAYLAGADVELVVRAMIKAARIGENLTWDDALQKAMKNQYDDYVEENYGDGT